MKKNVMIALTLLLAGRAMTLAFVARAGGAGVGDPPAAWLMPLVGDAIIGVTALGVAYALWRHRGLWVWTSVVVWNVVAIWDALSAFAVHHTTPWPEFFMIQIFGPAMFFAASAMHAAVLALALTEPVRRALIGEEAVVAPAL